METIVVVLMILVCFNFMMKQTFRKRGSVAAIAVVAALFVGLMCPYAIQQSKTQIADWLAPLQGKSASPLSNNLKTKFLCGIATPWFTKVKARSLTGFGKLSEHPYQRVLSEVESI